MRNLITNIETKTLQSAAVANGNGEIFNISGLGTITLQVLITGAGSTKVNFEITVDGTNWTAIKGTNVPGTNIKVISTTASGVFHFDVSAFSQFRARISDTVGVVSVTVFGAGVITGTGGLSAMTDTELNTDDLDTGVGTDEQAIVGIGLAESGGHTLLGSAKPTHLITGQASITGGTGVVAANTPRMTIATDDVNQAAAKTALEKIDDLQGALKSKDTDELISRITDSAGTEINPAKEDGNLATIAGDTTSIDGKIPAKGQTTKANSLPVTLASDQDNVNVDVPNNLLGVTTKGQATMANSLPVVLASDQSSIPVASDTELTIKDYDTGAGTDSIAVVGLQVPGNGGAVNLNGDAANGLDVDVTRISNVLEVTAKGQAASAGSLPAVLSTEQEVILTAIKTALEIIDNMISGSEAQVDVVSSALPTGAATNTKLDEIKALIGEVQASPTDNTILDRLKDLLTGIVLAAGSNIVGKVGIDQTTPGTTNRVDIGAALPAGTNAIGKLAANDGVDIGDVDVTSLPLASTISFGTVVISATGVAQALPTFTTKQGVIVVANENNDAANIVYVGGSTVTNSTYLKQLLPGESTPLLPVSNSNIIYVYCVFTGGTHSYNYMAF